MRQRIYLDTSVLSALGDTRAPDRQQLTQEFFDRLDSFDAASSTITRDEILATRDEKRREHMLSLLRSLALFPVTPDAQRLADRYLDAGAIPHSVPEDALHVAIAVLEHQDAIVSWNFKHLVNQRRRAAILAVNASMNLPTIVIVAPPELQ